MHPARGHQHYNRVNPDGMCSSSDEDDEIARDGRVMPKRAAATLQECNKPAGSDKRDAALANKMRKGCYRSAEDDYSEHSSFLDESDGDESERRDAQERQQRGIFHH